MPNSPDSANFELLISRNSIRERVSKALRLHVGRGKRLSVRELSQGSGVAARLIECAMTDPDQADCRPLKQEELFSIISILGSAFASSLLESCGLAAYELMEGEQIPLPKVLATASPKEKPADKVKRLSRELADALEDL